MTIAIAGNPNCGKTVLFNALTGSTQKVGNWSGVTVDRKEGTCEVNGQTLTIVDIPGIYSLHTTTSDEHTIDEKIACRYLREGDVSLIINVVDASNLDRHLYLTAQLLEVQIPVIIVLNMSDIAARRGICIDHQALAKQLGCPVIPLVASRKKGLDKLRAALTTTDTPPNAIQYNLPTELEQSYQALSQHLDSNWLALRLLEDDCFANECVSEADTAMATTYRHTIEATLDETADLLIADARYQWVHQIVTTHTSHVKTIKQTATQYIDKIVLNRYLGIPIFLLMMYLTFFFAINIGGAFQDFFDIGSTAIFIDGLSQLLHAAHAPAWLIAILANGFGKGINTVITFTPIIGGMFLFLSLLEDSGYMARAAFVVDRLMSTIGLPGKAFVPLIVGFGCNVPTIMATRTLGTQRDRILTTMMAPFMSCGARLAIYAVFVSAFFRHGGQNVIFFLYLLGIAVAILTGLLLRFTVLKGETSAMPTEFPTYHIPHPASILRSTWHRLKLFLKKAGRFIIPICMLIGALNAVSLEGKLLHGEANQHSALSEIGRAITPVFAPMGLEKDNWPATVGLFTGLLAKEVVVGTLNTLYTQVGHLHHDTDKVNVASELKNALYSIPQNLAALPQALSNPVLASAPMQNVNRGVFGVMHQFFAGTAGVLAYLIFILLYFPCVSTMAVMRREIGSRWANFSMVWTTGVAYGIATVFFQIATFHQHMLSSSLWVGGITIIFTVTIAMLRRKTVDVSSSHLPPSVPHAKPHCS